MAKKVLGKGLAALIPQSKLKTGKGSDVQGETSSLMLEIDVSKIVRNRYQPREIFDKEPLHDLMMSIKEHGILQPILVRPAQNNEYELIAGERRFRAAKELGLKKIPAIIRKVGKEESLELALIENVQRDNLNPIEEAKAYLKLAEEFLLTQDDIAKKIGKTRTVITNSIRLLKLPEVVQGLLSEGKISTGHARCLITINDTKAQVALANKIVELNLSVRAVEELVKKSSSLKDKVKKEKVSGSIFSQVVSMQDDMQRVLGTKVQINHKGTKGKIEIDYYSLDDLTRIWELFKVENY